MIPMVFTVGRMRLGNMSFKYLKLIDFLEFSRPDEKKSMNIILNESNLRKKSEIMCNDESKIFLQFNPSVSSSNSEQSVSTFNILTKL